MAGHSVGRAGVLVPPSLPTIRETTLSWLGSDLENSILKAREIENASNADEEELIYPRTEQLKYNDYEEQCLSLKSGEESDFSGIQPLPVGSDDTSPLERNFNRVMKMNFASLLSEEKDYESNRPKPFPLQMQSDDDQEESIDGKPNSSDRESNEYSNQEQVKMDLNDFSKLFSFLDSQILSENIDLLSGQGDTSMLQKLQAIRQWQIMQQEELKRQQQEQLALLQAKEETLQNTSNQVMLSNNDEEINENTEFKIKQSDKINSHDTKKPIINNHKDIETIKISVNNMKDQDNRETNMHEETPLAGATNFDDLLNKELENEQNSKPSANVNFTANEKPKHKFLRRGEGIARFNGPPVRKKQLKKSKNLETLNKPNNNRCNPPSLKSNAISNKSNLVKQKPIPKLQLKPNPQRNIKSVSSSNSSSGTSSGTNNNDEVQINVKQNQLNNNVFKENCNILRSVDKKLSKEVIHEKDLEEFEMLEQYAEEDASFFSEPSLVASVLKDKQIEFGQKSLRERVRERREAREREQQSKPISQDPITLNHKKEEQEVCVQGKISNLNIDSAPDEEDKEVENLSNISQPKIMRRKVVSLIKREKLAPKSPVSNINNLLKDVNNGQDFIRKMVISTPKHDTKTLSSSSESEYGDNLENSPEENDFDDDKTWEAINLSVQNGLLLEKESSSPVRLNEYKSSDYMEPENEEEENPVRDTDDPKSIVSNGRKLSLSPPPPPTTLMQKLFPSLKVPVVTAHEDNAVNSPGNIALNVPSKTEPTSQNQNLILENSSGVLKQKLVELEAEISKFRTENKNLENLRIDREKELENLANEMKEFQKQKNDELKRLEEHKKSEMRKLKKDRKVFEDHVMSTKALPTKEERDEIQKLKNEMETLKSELKTKEQRWASSSARLRSQVQRLEEENAEIKQQLQEVEEQRIKDLNNMQKMSKSKAGKNPSVWQTINKMVETMGDMPEASNMECNQEPKPISVQPSKSEGLKQKVIKSKFPKGKSEVHNNVISLPNKFSPISPATVSRESVLNKSKVDKIERVLENGNKVIEFSNGTHKEISPDGKAVKINFANGDIKSMLQDGTVVYFYKENGTTHTTHPDGLQVLEFPNKQVEHHFVDGTKQISFPDGTVKYLHTDGTEQTVFYDGTEMHLAVNGDKTIVFANGQREIHTSMFKRREYPDGTSKTVYNDGRQETRYASGRLRVKDSHGNVIIDRMTAPT